MATASTLELNFYSARNQYLRFRGGNCSQCESLYVKSNEDTLRKVVTEYLSSKNGYDTIASNRLYRETSEDNFRKLWCSKTTQSSKFDETHTRTKTSTLEKLRSVGIERRFFDEQKGIHEYAGNPSRQYYLAGSS